MLFRSAPEAMGAIVRALKKSGIDAGSAGAGIWELAHTIGAPTSLAQVGFDPTKVDETARIVVEGRPTNPRPVDLDGTRALLLAAYDGTRPGAWD